MSGYLRGESTSTSESLDYAVCPLDPSVSVYLKWSFGVAHLTMPPRRLWKQRPVRAGPGPPVNLPQTRAMLHRLLTAIAIEHVLAPCNLIPVNPLRNGVYLLPKLTQSLVTVGVIPQ